MPGSRTERIARRLGGAATRRRRHRRVALAAGLVVAVAAVLLIAGSGDDGDGDETASGDVTTTTAPLSDNPIVRTCQLSDQELTTAQRALLENNEAPGAAEAFLADAFVDLMRDRSAAIRALDPPPAPEVLAALDDFDAVVDAIEADPTIGIGTDPFEDVNARWQELGLDGCVIGSGTVAE